MLKRIATLLLICAFLLISASSSLTQTPRPPLTPTGFYYPVSAKITDDRNWLACGSSYYKDTRHIGADILNPAGTGVYAIAKGKVLYRSGPDESSGWGIGNYALAVLHSSKT